MQIEISMKKLAKNISFHDLQALTYEFNKIHNKTEAVTEDMFDSFKLHMKEQPDREIIYSNEFVEALIGLYEKSKELKEPFLGYAMKVGYVDKDGVKTDNFMEMMNFTHDTYGYDFGYIQDQVWYGVYPKYI